MIGSSRMSMSTMYIERNSSPTDTGFYLGKQLFCFYFSVPVVQNNFHGTVSTQASSYLVYIFHSQSFEITFLELTHSLSFKNNQVSNSQLLQHPYSQRSLKRPLKLNASIQISMSIIFVTAGILSTITVLGPAVAFLGGGAISKLHVSLKRESCILHSTVSLALTALR